MKATGLSADSRRQLNRLLQGSPPLVTTSREASTLGLPASVAARRLAAWSGAVYKRLGYSLQRDQRDQTALLEACGVNLSSGYAKLGTALPADGLVTAWRSWEPSDEVGAAIRRLGRR